MKTIGVSITFLRSIEVPDNASGVEIDEIIREMLNDFPEDPNDVEYTFLS